MKFKRIFIFLILTLASVLSVVGQKQAEVIVTLTYVRKMPDISAEKLQTLEKGEKITFEKNQETNGWFYVSTANSKIKGWIRKDTIRAVKSDTPPAPPQIKAPTVVRSAPISAPVTKLPTAPVSPPVPATTPVVEEEEEVVRVETEEVNLNVRVVDSNNRPVNNLNKAQFEVYEDDILQPVTALVTTEVPVINALVIDNSRSLRPQLAKIIEAGKIIVGTNRAPDESAIVRFVSADKIEVVQDFTPSKSSLNNALDNLFVEGGQTAIIDAVYQTAKKVEQYQSSQKKEDVKLRALILVSDGDDRSSRYTEQQLFDLLRESHVQIYAVGFINDLSKDAAAGAVSRQENAKNFLTKLAQETGGKVYFPNSIDDLPQIAADISGELRTQYLISYIPTNQKRDGAFRKIKVSVAEGANREKRIAVTRSGRNAPPK